MYRDGHYGAALLAHAPVGFVVASLGYPALALLSGGLALALAMVPDWDVHVPGMEHRGATHTLLFAVLVGALVGGAGVALATAGDPAALSDRLAVPSAGPGAALGLGALGFAVGFLTTCSHVAADALTPAGVTPLWPVSGRHVSAGLVTADHRLANALLLAAGVAVAGGAYGLAAAL
jgi:inner membrane protein